MGKKYSFDCFLERIRLVIKKATGTKYVMKLLYELARKRLNGQKTKPSIITISCALILVFTKLFYTMLQFMRGGANRGTFRPYNRDYIGSCKEKSGKGYCCFDG